MLGVLLQVPPPSLPFYTNASMTGLAAHLQDLTATGIWSWKEEKLHFSILEMKAVQLTLNAFLPIILEESVLLSDNTTVMANLRVLPFNGRRYANVPVHSVVQATGGTLAYQ